MSLCPQTVVFSEAFWKNFFFISSFFKIPWIETEQDSVDIVLDIINKPFGTRNIAEKREILRVGRPTPFFLENKVGIHV